VGGSVSSYQPSVNDQVAMQLLEANQRLNKIINLLIGVIITTGIVALAVIIVAVKIGEAYGGR
jgi:hypothetical protein